MKTTLARVVLLIVAVSAMWPHAAPATEILTIKDGFIISAGDPVDTGYNFGSDRFRVDGLDQNIIVGQTIFSGGVSGIIIGKDGPRLFPPSPTTPHNVVVVGVGTCDGVPFGGPTPPKDCGFLQLSNPPAAPPADFSRYDVSVPFTATGHLDVGDGFDIIGAGVLRAEFCATCSPGSLFQRWTYTFVTPEPSTWLLLAGGLMLLMTCTAAMRNLVR